MLNNFSHKTEFLDWKVGLEETSNCNYFQSTGNKNNQTGETTYYYCSRSGMYQNSDVNRTRNLKSQGSCKIDDHCTANIVLTKTSDGVFKMEACNT